MDATFLLIIEIIGTVAAAISGIRLAATKNFDWFGAYTVGLVTAIGGGKYSPPAAPSHPAAAGPGQSAPAPRTAGS